VGARSRAALGGMRRAEPPVIALLFAAWLYVVYSSGWWTKQAVAYSGVLMGLALMAFAAVAKPLRAKQE